MAAAEQSHFEAQDSPGDCSDREQHRRHFGPAVCEPKRDRIVADDASAVRHIDHRGESHAKTGEDDVPAQRHSHLLAGLKQASRNAIGRDDGENARDDHGATLDLWSYVVQMRHCAGQCAGSFAPLAVAPTTCQLRYWGINTQNSWPSGSAITTQLTSLWPMSSRVAPRETRRSTSAC